MNSKSNGFVAIRAILPCFVLLLVSCSDASDPGEVVATKSESGQPTAKPDSTETPDSGSKNGTTQSGETTRKDKAARAASDQLIPSQKDSKAKAETANSRTSTNKEDERVSYEMDEEPEPPESDPIDIPKNWTRVLEEQELWIDVKNKQVMVGGKVCLKAGPLEMFICPEGSKEHESVIAAKAMASQVHRALLALDVKPGKPSSWNPTYRPVHGPVIEIDLMYRDPDSKKIITENAKKWIRNTKTKKAMTQQWVFGGSEFWEDPDTGEKVYYADSGEMVCLSNFSTASIDVNVKSSESNANLLFDAFTANIPPVGTRVYMIFKPGKIIPPRKAEPMKEPETPESDESTSDPQPETDSVDKKSEPKTQDSDTRKSDAKRDK
ncbi:MAG: YdjY domain-containing protein [Mariniblastus sp.]